jgi:stage V sporulation protein B
MTQLLEQLVRIGFVFGASLFFAGSASPETNCRMAVWGLVAGETSSCLYNLFKLWRHCKKRRASLLWQNSSSLKQSNIKTLFWLSSTLTGTRLLLTLLNSMESVLLPAMLRTYGCSQAEALSIYGILTGMCFSFLFFPSTVTNSFSVMLVPSIADAHARKDIPMIRRSISLSIKYCILLGLLCTCLFFVFGRELGILFFHNEDAGSYLITLSWLCPFLYLGTTLTSIINGMEKTQVTFFITLGSIAVKIFVLLAAVPVWGIRAYLIGLLVSQLLQVIWELLYLSPYLSSKNTGQETAYHPWHWIVLPSLFLLCSGITAKNSYQWLGSCLSQKYAILNLGITGGLLCILYVVFLWVMGILPPVTSRQESPF